MFLRDWQVVEFQGAHVRLDGLLDVGQSGILRFALGDAAGKAGALGDPEAIFPAIDENLSHRLIMPDSEADGRPRGNSFEQRGEMVRGHYPRAFVAVELQQSTFVARHQIIGPAGFGQSQQKIVRGVGRAPDAR